MHVAEPIVGRFTRAGRPRRFPAGLGRCRRNSWRRRSDRRAGTYLRPADAERKFDFGQHRAVGFFHGEDERCCRRHRASIKITPQSLSFMSGRNADDAGRRPCHRCSTPNRPRRLGPAW